VIESLLVFAWLWFSLGIVSGAVLGLVFHREDGWGGYGSWRRRLARLGHISFFGTGFLVLAMALTAHTLWISIDMAGTLSIAGAIAMPTVCFLAAWRKPLRHLFAIPVVCLAFGVFGFTLQVLLALLTQEL